MNQDIQSNKPYVINTDKYKNQSFIDVLYVKIKI